HLRVNIYQPSKTDRFSLSYEQFWDGFRRLLGGAGLVATTEPVLAAVLGLPGFTGPGCGRTTVRVAPDGRVLPCTYWPESRLTIADLRARGEEIMETPEFRQARETPAACDDCPCLGGCAGRRALLGKLSASDPYCPFARRDRVVLDWEPPRRKTSRRWAARARRSSPRGDRRVGKPRIPPVITLKPPLPRSLYLETTSRCNSLCETCILTFGGRETQKDLHWDEFRRVVDQFPALYRVLLHGIGEPLLNRDLIPMIAHLKERGATVLFNSNVITLGPRLRRQLIESGLDELRVSLDATTPATYPRVRGLVSQLAGRPVGTEHARKEDP
ncbi:MAG: radical SAM protein, partial [Candidatus Rokuibacteriota bacterium]